MQHIVPPNAEEKPQMLYGNRRVYLWNTNLKGQKQKSGQAGQNICSSYLTVARMPLNHVW